MRPPPNSPAPPGGYRYATRLPPAALSSRTQPEYLSRFRRRRRPPVIELAHVDDLAHELRIARRKPRRIEARVVLQPRPAVAAGLQTHAVHFPLEAPDARRDPGSARQHFGELGAQKIEDGRAHRHRVGNPQHEL